MTLINTPKFKEFQAKRKEWVNWFSGDDPHSIMQQIYRMIWNAAVYRVINECRWLAPKLEKGGVELNGMVHVFINNCFLEAQSNAIRRLLDKETSTGKRSVYSLYRLIDDIERNAYLLTRENILAAEGLEYDYHRLQEAWEQKERELIRAGKTSWCVPRELDAQVPADRHKQLDRLAGVEKNARSEKDSVRQEILNKLTVARQRCEKMLTYATKFVAHAASPESRASENADDLNVTFGDLWEAHATICKIANFLSRYILDGSAQGFLPFLRGDEFDYLERPWVAKENVQCLRDVWERYHKETESWTMWGLHEFEAEWR